MTAPAPRPMDFSQALDELKKGNRVARQGWNGKGMWLKLVPADEWRTYVRTDVSQVVERLPWIGMKTADNKFVPWLCSQTDMLAEDWVFLV